MIIRTVIFLFALLSTFSAEGAGIAVGKPAPVIKAKLLDATGNIQAGGGAGESSDKVTIINFWASWCVPCRIEMPALQSYYDKHKSQGLEVLAISMDEARDLAEVRMIAGQYTFPIAVKADADFKGLGRIWRMPSTFVIDRHGILRKNGIEGSPTIDLDSLEALVTPLLEQP